MGAFLAALGAVLLFILRVIGILLLVVLILLVLLLLCPFCADLCWEHGVLTVKGRCAGHHLPGVPVPEAGAAARTGKPGAAQGLWQGQGKVCRMAGRAQAEKGRGEGPQKRPPPLPPRQTSPPSRAKRQRSRWRSSAPCSKVRAL